MRKEIFNDLIANLETLDTNNLFEFDFDPESNSYSTKTFDWSIKSDDNEIELKGLRIEKDSQQREIITLDYELNDYILDENSNRIQFTNKQFDILAAEIDNNII